MINEKQIWKERIAHTINALLEEGDERLRLTPEDIIAETPPKPEMGDIAFPMFPFAKLFRMPPPAIAALAATRLAADGSSLGSAGGAKAEAVGPYVNVSVERGPAAVSILQAVFGTGVFGTGALGTERDFRRSGLLRGRRVMVEFSSPNTNKPLHLGHLRNDALGESVSRILSACGADVHKVCIINDRGIHICKSMLAYAERFAGQTPERAGKKSDRFVGDCYVEFGAILKADPQAEERARSLLRKWEAGDTEVGELWRKMNRWAVEGIRATYERTGVSFDRYYFESETYLRGKKEVLKGLEAGVFYREEDGSVWADLTAEGLDRKTLLRSDGTSLYITQDFGTAIARHEDWPFDRLVYVVGSEQRYHFQVLFSLLARLGFEWARDLYHLSYGMVNLPDGRMKSREGTVVDADGLLDSLKAMALAEIRAKRREEAVGDAEAAAEKIALGALHYYLLQASPEKDMLFNPAESLSFNGNTGPYLQYMGARLSSLLRKEGGTDADGAASDADGTASDADGAASDADYALLTGNAEWELLKTVSAWPAAVEAAAERMDPSVITAWLYELSKNFSRFYHDCPILNAEDADLRSARLALCRAVLHVLRAAFDLVCIPFLETM